MTHRRSFIKKSLAASALLGINFEAMATSFDIDPTYAAAQATQRRRLFSLLGDVPLNHVPRAPQLLRKEKHEGYTLEYLVFDFNGMEPVPGILLVPDNLKGKAPCMLYSHAHGGTYDLGKDELLKGRDILPAYAPVCAQKGILTLAIDCWCFGERKHLPDGRQGEHDTFKKMLWNGQSLFGMMMFDEMKAFEYLLSRPEADPSRAGVFGLSMGSTKAWWLAALDTRVRTCMDLCCLTDYEELLLANNVKGHGFYYYVPGLLKYFDTKSINELIVPRPRVSLNGRRDTLAPAKGVEKIRDYLLPLYKKHGKESDCLIELFDCGHEEIPEMRQIILSWMDIHLTGT